MAQLITIVGSTGIGKTALAQALAAAGNFATGLEEHNERPFQARFARDPRYALHNQVDYLLLRAEQEMALRRAPQIALIDGGLDVDFHGFTRLFHARGYLDDEEFDLCRRLYGTLRAALPPPELIIRLTAPQEVIRRRLASRERINVATPEDLSLLESFLDEWLASVSPERILPLDVSADDPTYERILPNLLVRIRAHLLPEK